MRRLLQLSIVCLTLGVIVLACGWFNARADPVVRYARVDLPGWLAGAPPMRVVLTSDLHIGNRVTDAARLARIADRINALKPDLVLLAGDFIAGHRPGTATELAPEFIQPLERLRPRLATVAVLGNHDHWTGANAVRKALDAAGVIVLDNGARRFGALTLVGIGDAYTRNDRIDAAMAAARRLPGPRMILTHGPDIVPELPADAPLVLTGHTHCGQIVLPLWGALSVPSNYGSRYLCGVIREGGRATIVTGGLGTSVLPLRYGAPPDLWVLTPGPSHRR